MTLTLEPRPKIYLPAFNKLAKITTLGHDFETFSRADLKKVSADAYSRHPSTEILMCAYTFNKDEEVKQWVPPEGEWIPSDLEDALLDERVLKTCWNKAFEYAIWKNVHGIEIPHNQWRDTQALAMSLALPKSLDKAGPVVDLDPDDLKSDEGTALITLFSKPRKPSKYKPWDRTFWWMEPEKWERYKHYNRQDVKSERAILLRILPHDMPEHEWEMWVIDQEINERGIPFNMKAVDAAIKLYEWKKEVWAEDLKEITGLKNPNSGPQLLPWLQDHGYVFDDLKAGHIKRAADALAEKEKTDELTEKQTLGLRALEIRAQSSRTSPTKFLAIERCVERMTGLLRNTFQFAGAGRTWRWAGRVFQPQNLPRPHIDFEKLIEMIVWHLEIMEPEEIDAVWGNPIGLLVSCIRAVIQAPDGYMLYDADLNAIENRMLGWMTGDSKILRVFKLDRDPYIDFATYLFEKPYAVLWDEYKIGGDKAKRTVAKPGVLGCGYQLGIGEEKENKKTGEIEATGLLGYARNMGVNFTKEQAELSVNTFRETYTAVVSFWADIEKAAKRCVRTGKPTDINMIRFDRQGPFLRMVLPSGRALHYCRPRLEATKTKWGAEKESITFEQQNDTGQWGRISTYGGKLTENADQAMSRDILAHGIKKAYYRGLDVFLHVHDQAVGMAPEDEAEEHLRILKECMEDVPPEYAGLPLKAAGHVSKVFLKD